MTERRPPTLVDIVADPTRVADIDAAAVPEILTRLTTVTAALAARMPFAVCRAHQLPRRATDC